MQQSPDYTPKSYLKINKILYSALAVGVLIITVIFMALVEKPHFHMDFEKGGFMLIAPIVCAVGLGMSNIMFKKFVEQAKQKTSLKEKLNAYRSSLLIGLALCEAPAIFANVAFMEEGNQFYQILAMVCIALMLTYNPTEKKLIKDLDLRGDDLDKLRDKESKIKS